MRDPPRLVATGRTAWPLSVAGGHLVGAELDAAIVEAAAACGRSVVEYSAALVRRHADSGRGRLGVRNQYQRPERLTVGK